jgi:hypothetical protein
MASGAKTTTNRGLIKKWIEDRNGKPACVKGTGGKDDVGLLRVNFPGGAEDSLEDISWDDFFRKFEESNLAFLYDDDENSTFNKFIKREE